MAPPQAQEWHFRQEDVELAALISADLEIHPLVARVLVARGHCDIRSIYDMLHPDLGRLHDPFLMEGMDRAVDRIGKALSKGERIAIHGDYDVDGISSTALLYSFLGKAARKGTVSYLLPSRFGEGYGVSTAAVDALHERGASLVLTVDCGVQAVEAVDRARELGIDVIVTDHHEPGDVLPGALAVLDPKVKGSRYPFKELSGVGVTFKLASALQVGEVVREEARQWLDLVALGTISDLVPLEDENRLMVKFGLESLQSSDNLGLLSLMREAGIEAWKGLTASDISFKIAPRLNAAGRLGTPDLALELILAKDRVDADVFARQLSTLNFKRQAVGKKVFEEIWQKIKEKGLDRRPTIVTSAEGLNPGVLGITANKVMEETGKVSIVMGLEGGVARGSARAPAGFNLIDALSACSDLLAEWGGHEKAAGITMDAGKIEKLHDRLDAYTLRNYPDLRFVPVLDIDLDASLEELTLEGIRGFEVLRPFGTGNPAPVVGISEVKVGYDVMCVGEGRHLRFQVEDGSSSLRCIWFGKGELERTLLPGTMVSLAGTPDINRWGGSEEVQLRVIDLIPLE